MGDFHRPHITLIIIHKTEFVKYERIIDMKKFDTLTDLEVLNLAYDSILRMWNEAKESNEDCKKDLGSKRIWAIVILSLNIVLFAIE